MGLPNKAAPPESPTILAISLIRNDKGNLARRVRWVSGLDSFFASFHFRESP